MMRIVVAILFLQLGFADAHSVDEWVFLDNGTLRLGVNKTAGACVGFLSAGQDSPNVLNSFDRGRFVQQSYYGDSDGSTWAGSPWRYNPVQGGYWKGKPGPVLEFKAEGSSLYAKTRPIHWATGAEIPEMIMEQWIELKEALVKIRFRMRYLGEKTHPVCHQEIPAFFVQPEFGTLVMYDGDKPWTGGDLTRRQPGFPNESARLAEHWAAWVDSEDRGVGLYIEATDRATCYRYGNGAMREDSCSYIAPLAEFALRPGLVWEYEAWITLGSVAEIRDRFTALHRESEHSK